MLQLPPITVVKVPLDVIVHTPVVDDVKLTPRPEVALALKVGLVPKLWLLGLLKVIL